MTDNEIVDQLRASARTSSAVSVASLLDRILPEGLTQGAMVSYFKRAFPEIPLSTLLEAGSWSRLSAGWLSDADFEALLRPWWPCAGE